MSEPTPVSADALADRLRPLLGRALVGFDVDGVLAPIVEHATEARLTPGVHDSLARLAEQTEIAILSGRSLGDLEHLFGFPDGVHVIGSHGLEIRGDDGVALDPDEQYTFDQLELLGRKAVEAAGDGAWLEYKPASVVVHTRAADPSLAEPALDAVGRLAGLVDGGQVKPGHHVVELLARSASKGEALLALAHRLGRSPLVFLGDDVTDEDAFALMGDDDDVSVRVGPGRTLAKYRLAGPGDVAELLAHLA
ncbi:MAG: trehalose-phosphatase [Acidimicrobiia bacterium]